jgi:hypothetical protein
LLWLVVALVAVAMLVEGVVLVVTEPLPVVRVVVRLLKAL